MIFQVKLLLNRKESFLSSLSLKDLFTKAIFAIIIFGGILRVPVNGFLEEPRRGNLLSISISMPESHTLPDNRNPEHATKLEKVQQLLIDIAQAPKDTLAVNAALEGTGIILDDLLAMELIRKQAELYIIGFSLLTQEDQPRLKEICAKFAEHLAGIYYERWPEFEKILETYPVKSVSLPTLAYILLGCFSLDWDGLDVTEKLGFRFTSPPKDKPFIWYAHDRRAKDFLIKKGFYWGSHNESLENGVCFTTFGDHATLNRYGFPDLAWQMMRSLERVVVPEDIKPLFQRAGRRAIRRSFLNSLGDIMMTLRSGPKNVDELSKAASIAPQEMRELLIILEGLQYIRENSGTYETVVPIFAEEDRAMIQSLLKPSRDIITNWLTQNIEPIKRQLSPLSAFKYGQPVEVFFYQLWHEIFGVANRILVEKGIFVDPYEEARKYKGYIPVIWHKNVYEEFDIP